MTTLVIGIDGACRRLLAPLREAGAVPHLAQLIHEGASGPLASPIPFASTSAWPSLFTGTNPGKHGVFGHLHFDGYDWRGVDASAHRARPLWEILDHYGLASVVVNVPVTHPPRPFEGALIPGRSAPSTPTCHPEGLLEDVRAATGGYRVYPNENAASQVAEFRELVRMRGAAFRYLTTQFAPDFGLLGFSVTDPGSHDWPDEDALAAIYEAVDEEVGATIEACRPENVFVLSVHGSDVVGGYAFRVNEYLRNAGFVEGTRQSVHVPPPSSATGDRLDGSSDTRELSDPVHRRVLGLLTKATGVGPTARRILPALGRDNPLQEDRAGTEGGANGDRVDFAASRAYVRSPAEGGVRINLAGREPDGVVPREDYFEVRDEVMAVLSAARTPDGDAVFSEVAPREEYFDGPAADEAVDVVTIPQAFDHVVSLDVEAPVFADPSRRWRRIPEGVLVASGSAIDTDTPLDDAHLFDVAPAVLATFDVPAAERMDGSTLPIVASSGVRVRPRSRRRRGRSGPAPSIGQPPPDFDSPDRDR